jgi:hypothetical protein
MPGEIKSVNIELENDIVYAGFQFDLYLPEGISLTDYSADKTRIPEGTTLTMAQQKDGGYRFIAAAMDLKEITGNSGSIITIRVIADENLKAGSLKGDFQNVKLSKVNGKGATYDDMPFIITVNEDIEPVKESESVVDFSENSSITEETDLSDTVVDNMYYTIDEEDGGYDADEGCIVINKETNDEQMANVEGKEVTNEEVKENFTGIIFKVTGNGSVMVTAETFGNMTLKVKIGNLEPIELELSSKTKMTFPFSVLEETLVYIFAGMKNQNAARAVKKTGDEQSLKIYSIELEQKYDKGDANKDGKVDAKDIMEVVNYLMGNQSDKFNFETADANEDGVVNTADIVLIVNTITDN